MNFKFDRYYWFVLVFIIVKIILMGLFSSDYQIKLFMPFVQAFIDGTANGNPYEYYYRNGLPSSFPYPPMMLFIESAGMTLIHIFHIQNIFVSNIIFKLPNLFFDLLGLYFLRKLYPSQRRYVGILYFASPIIIYSSYMHGQLDIIPTSLLLGAVYFLIYANKNLTKDNKQKQTYLYFIFFVLAFSAAILSKQHVLAILPILFLYSLNKHGIKRSIISFGSVAVLCIVVVIPFSGMGFLQNVLLNAEQNILTQIYFPFLETKLLLPLLALIFVYSKFFLSDSINTELFLSFCGIGFSVILIFVLPMPGWYIWIVPYITIFFIQTGRNKYKNLIVFIGLNFFCLLYFVVFRIQTYTDLYFLNVPMGFLKIKNIFMENIVFTLMEGFLISSTVIVYQLGIIENKFYQRKSNPFIIGISGDSGSGKTMLAENIKDMLGDTKLIPIEGDGDHKWERNEKMWDYFTHLDPKANYLYRQAIDIATLKNGNSIFRVDYNHDTGKFTEAIKIRPKRFILISGLHSFYLPQMRKLIDLKVFMDTDPELQAFWKIKRDTQTRGYTLEKIIQQIEARKGDVESYIAPQREYADLIIRYFDPHLPKKFDASYKVCIWLKITVSASVDIEPLLYQLSKYQMKVDFDFTEDLNKQVLTIGLNESSTAQIPFAKLANNIIPQLYEITKSELDESDECLGVIKLIILYLISIKMQGIE
ncbi:uridine kinase [Lachnospiraceae bacterium ZAX-1]